MRRTQRLTAAHGALLVVDMQGKLLDLIADRDSVVANSVLLIKAAKLLGLPVWSTEQYPKGLGPTIAEIADLVPDRPAKTMFHCCSTALLLEQLYGRHIRHVTVIGIEAHVCIAQTALELMDLGFRVQVIADAVTSRKPIDREFALRRLDQAGAVVSTTEAAIFEWTETADRPEFKAISALIKAATEPSPHKAHRTLQESDRVENHSLSIDALALESISPAPAWTRTKRRPSSRSGGPGHAAARPSGS